MPAREITLLSPYPLDECRRRLRDVTTPSSFLAGWRPSSTTILHERPSHLRLHVYRPFVRNSFGLMVFVHLGEDPNGTKLELRLRMHPFARGFLTFWFAGALGIPLIGFTFAAVRSGMRLLPTLAAVGAGMALPALGFLLLKFSFWLSQPQVTSIVDLIKATLHATEAPEAVDGPRT